MSQFVCTVEFRRSDGAIAHQTTSQDAPDGATASDQATRAFQSERPEDCVEVVEIVCEEAGGHH